MGGKPKPPKHPGEAPKRSGKSKIIWRGVIQGRKARIVAVDKDSSDPFPCQLIYEVLMKDGMGKESWGEEGSYGLTLLEKMLVSELVTSGGKMPKWSTDVGQAERDKKERAWHEAVDTFRKYEAEQAHLKREAEKKRVAVMMETDQARDLKLS